jgi:FkbM family methyltransferase
MPSSQKWIDNKATVIRSIKIQMNKKQVKSKIAQFSSSASQTGQDLWVFGEAFNEKRAGFFVDIGAHDGVTISNTVILERRYSWQGICVEANPITFSSLKRSRKCTCINACLDDKAGEVDFRTDGVFGGIVSDGQAEVSAGHCGSSVVRLPTRTLTAVLDNAQAPLTIDYMSIDVEGAEERVLAGLDCGRYTFKTITIERPSDATKQLLLSQGYECVKSLPGLDYYYIHSSFKEEYVRNTYLYYSRLRFSLRLP